MARITHRELAVRLVVEGALSAFTETVAGQLPVKPEVLTDSEVRSLGLPPGGTALFYPLGEKGVFFDMAGSRIVVWYSGADADRAPALLDSELRRAYRETKQVSDAEHPSESDLRLRVYDVKLGNGRLATVEVSYSKPGARSPKFSAQVVGMAIKN